MVRVPDFLVGAARSGPSDELSLEPPPQAARASIAAAAVATADNRKELGFMTLLVQPRC
jgi:hypothetical protein